MATDFYAQDEHGNVWWFGRDGEWLAGEDGAEAGLAMADHPRVGDGYRQAFAPGVVDLRAEVLAIGDQVTIAVTSPLTGKTVESSYEEGVGLVSLETVEGEPEMQLGLVAYDEP